MNLDPQILDDLQDLHKQATTERSHYYVAKVVERAQKVITRQNAALAACHKEIADLRNALLSRPGGGDFMEPGEMSKGFARRARDGW